MSLATGLTSSMTSEKEVLSEATDVQEEQNTSKEVEDVFPGGEHGPGRHHKSSSVNGIPSSRRQEAAYLIK